MKNYSFPEHTHTVNNAAATLSNEIMTTMNQAYKRQMEMSIQFYNRIFDLPVIDENNIAKDDNFWGLRVWQNNMHKAKHSLDRCTNLAKQMAEAKNKQGSVLSKELLKMFVENYERQIQEIKEYNNQFIDSLEYTSHVAYEHTSRVIKNFRKSTENNLDLFMHTVNGMFNSGEQNIAVQIVKEIDSLTKLNFEIWADLVEIVGNPGRAGLKTPEQIEKEHAHKQNREKDKDVGKRPEYHDFKANKRKGHVDRTKPRLYASRKK